MSLHTAFVFTCLLSCISCGLSSAEFLYIRKEFRPMGVFSWKVHSAVPKCAAFPSVFEKLQFLFDYRGTVALHLIRLVSCLLLPIATFSENQSSAVLIVVIFVSSLILSFRHSAGNDGSDQMIIVLFGGLCAFAFSKDPFIQMAGLIFIAAQSALSYLVSGIAKLMSQKWRSGLSVLEITNTQTYGHQDIAKLLQSLPRTINIGLCWSVIAFEILFCLALVVPTPAVWLLLILGLAFHVCNAVVMGLNNFVWSWIATYPSIILLNCLLVQGWQH